MVAPATKAIIFDCFGVLYLDVKQSLLNTVPEDQAEQLADVFMQNNYGMMSRWEYVETVAQITGMTAKEFEDFTQFEHRLNTVLVEKIPELKKDYNVGLLSNIGRGWIQEFFDAHQIHDLFDEVVLSGEEGIAKPHPHIYELMAARLGVDPCECIMIDDIADNCAGADAAGMRSLHFQNNRQCLAELDKMLA